MASPGIIDMLVQMNLLAKEDVAVVKKEMSESKESLEEILSKHGIKPEDVLRVKGDFMGIPTRSLENQDIQFGILKNIPEESAVHYKIVPIDVKDGVLEVGMTDPENIEAKDALNFISTKVGMPFKIFLISETDFERVLQMYKGLSGEVTKALSELETELTAEEKELTDALELGTDTKIIEEAPVTKIVATVIHYATEGNASDIHIEPMADKVRVRFRVDGVLNTSIVLPMKVHSAVIARVKILCNMRLDEKRKPQDGRFSAKIEGRKIDFRVSTFPTYYGEKVVMRILDPDRGVKNLDNMGLSERNLALIREGIQRPFGMILISGPTGSGKSTTLYAMLNEMDRERENVLSLEDPVEYNIPGMNQSQVKPEIGYTFASGLRSILRQDPDVIMVGEIRDKETAQLAVQAALTGHLVLSTIHTNSSIGVVPRLIDMGVDPYLIPPTLILAMAQRLVKKICPNSGKPMPVEGSIEMMINREFEDLPDKYRKELTLTGDVLEAAPSADCPQGTRGRAAVFEVMSMDKQLELAILKNANEQEIRKIARNQGMLFMKEDAIVKALRHEIPFEEVNKL